MDVASSSKRALEEDLELDPKRSRSTEDHPIATFLSPCHLLLYADKPSELSGVTEIEAQQNILSKLEDQDSNKMDWFLSNLEDYLDDQIRLYYALMPIRSTIENSDSILELSADSPIQLILSIKEIQDKVVDVLLTKLMEVMYEDDIVIEEANITCNMGLLLIRQFKWMNYPIDSMDAINKLFETVKVLPKNLQKEMIKLLPEMINDDKHEQIGKLLRQFQDCNVHLIGSIIAALANLNIHSQMETEIRESLAKGLRSFNFEDLPDVLRFILQSVSNNTAAAVEIILKLHNHINLPNRSLLLTTDIKGDAINSCAENLLEVLETTIRFKKSIADGWIKVIDSLIATTDLHLTDIFVLFIAHSLPNYHRSIIKVFKKKSKHYKFITSLLSLCFKDYYQMIPRYLRSILSIADTLSQSSQDVIRDLGCHFYILIFSMNNTSYQQEVIGCLLTHIGSGIEYEADSALNVLRQLAVENLQSLKAFSVLILGVMEFIHLLTDSQIRALYFVLCRIAFSENCNDSIQDDIHIILRKQLTHSKINYRLMGVTGGTTAVSCLASQNSNKDQTENSSSNGLAGNESALSQATELLELLYKSCDGIPEVAALLYDELAGIITSDNISIKVKTWINELIVTTFQESYLVDLNELPTCDELPTCLKYGLDNPEDSSIAVNLLPKLVSELKGGSFSENISTSFASFASQFHLLWICEKYQRGNLDEIDALLGCPIILADSNKIETFSTLETELQIAICISLIYCLNWFREVIGAFASYDDAEVKGKILSRIKGMTELETDLINLLNDCPSCVPVIKKLDFCAFKKLLDVEKPLKLQIARKKEGKEKENISMTQDLKKAATKDKVTVTLNRCYLRELSMDVFNILSCGKVTCSILDSGLNTEIDRQTMRLFSRWKPVEVGKFFVQLIPIICQNLEAIHASLLNEEDKETDGASDTESIILDDAVNIHIVSSYSYLITCLVLFLEWSVLSQAENQQMKRDALTCIASRTNTINKDTPINDIVGKCFRYLEKFLPSLPSFMCATKFIRLLQAINVISNDKVFNLELATIIMQHLKRDWPDSSKFAKSVYKKQIAYLLRLHLQALKEPLSTLEEITNENLPESVKKIKEKPFSTLTRSTFSIYYQVLLEFLVESLKRLVMDGSAWRGDELNKLLQLQSHCNLLYSMVNLVKVLGKRPVLLSVIKGSHGFIDVFLRYAMPALDKLFRAHKDIILSILKAIQQSTRYLHHVCGHSKNTRVGAVTKFVPLLKKKLEIFVYRVKIMLTVNNCHEAFWVGNLKNRDIQGQEILSDTDEVDDESSVADGEESPNNSDEETSDDEEDSSDADDESGSDK
ncbi:uncharacterized protein TRIADDRAFT_55926 [Trichoplax adhaerens]|uniref:Fanconi anemia group D2 protein n=1 Tax=Trichoplax adhaerens TaxID=10228 RepID=B3RTH4_TRIAD|nr:hypothetical protein TRIADDRAFT_55926 [Trichoplax adhaerens]EDV26134.1 hypothetical protein TRIADDRAFT_55926 [Trichoplax adhaerens]|eukprot:XP_002112167.1 hypothetical protein TRIADDRAFT_55926 [Trichoplax adhaerens]